MFLCTRERNEPRHARTDFRGANTRAQLNELYVINGALIVTSDDPSRFLMAHKVTNPGGGSHLVHFAAEAGRWPSRDVVLMWQQLAAAESLEGVLHMVFGVLGGGCSGELGRRLAYGLRCLGRHLHAHRQRREDEGAAHGSRCGWQVHKPRHR